MTDGSDTLPSFTDVPVCLDTAALVVGKYNGLVESLKTAQRSCCLDGEEAVEFVEEWMANAAASFEAFRLAEEEERAFRRRSIPCVPSLRIVK